MTLDSKVHGSVDLRDVKFAKIHGSALKIVDGEKETLAWTGEYGDELIVDGKYCTQLSSNVNNKGQLYFLSKNVVDSVEVLKLSHEQDPDFFLRNQSIENPYNSSKVFEIFEITVNISTILLNQVECFFCDTKMVDRKKMRLHIGIHMILKSIPINPTTCGFCGTMGCSLSLETNIPGKNAPNCPLSNCTFFTKFSLKSAEKSTKTSPCTNRPVKCEVCKLVYWSYNIQIHYERNHIGHNIPSMISEDEIIKMKSIGI